MYRGDGTQPSVTEAGVLGTSNPGDLAVISEVFSMFKNYFEVKLNEKSKQIESRSKVDKNTLVKFKVVISNLNIMPR